ncbi:hypothetical protein BaRGS_00022376 [Batillaria attramentaria]|uniref:Uncharacterized protein n=1 Tax=Batillaria attramentaria TaxID=370345 RepID=A0ABD0KGL6_9CAEN
MTPQHLSHLAQKTHPKKAHRHRYITDLRLRKYSIRFETSLVPALSSATFTYRSGLRTEAGAFQNSAVTDKDRFQSINALKRAPVADDRCVSPPELTEKSVATATQTTRQSRMAGVCRGQDRLATYPFFHQFHGSSATYFMHLRVSTVTTVSDYAGCSAY